MLNRREFLSIAVAAGVGGPIIGRQVSAVAATSLRILILSDTGFIGQHQVAAALERGHKVSVLSRSPTTLLPSVVEQLSGDRNGDLGSVQGRDWDAVIDTDTHVPLRVRTLGLALEGRVKHYTFISSIDVYDRPNDNDNGTDERSKLLKYDGATNPYAIDQAEGKEFGPLGVLCEREAESQLPGRTLIVRPGLLVGPGDPAGAFTYWPVRIASGGEIIAAGDTRARVQMIDVRDVAEWVIRLVEKSVTGIFNAVGPAKPLSWGEMLAAISGNSSESAKLIWVPEPWLAAQGVPTLSNLRFWPSEAAMPGSMHMRNDKARDHGLASRPLAATAADTLAWYRAQPKHLRTQLLLGLTGMYSVEDSMKQEQELLVAWHKYQATTTLNPSSEGR